jgi:hypothetical protein
MVNCWNYERLGTLEIWNELERTVENFHVTKTKEQLYDLNLEQDLLQLQMLSFLARLLQES